MLLKSRGYLEQRADYLRDPYDIAIVCYALQLTGSPKAAEVIKKLEPKPCKCNLFQSIFILNTV